MGGDNPKLILYIDHWITNEKSKELKSETKLSIDNNLSLLRHC